MWNLTVVVPYNCLSNYLEEMHHSVTNAYILQFDQETQYLLTKFVLLICLSKPPVSPKAEGAVL